jgi:hypothetical protein
LLGEKEMRKQRFIIGLSLFLGLAVSVISGTILRLNGVLSHVTLFVGLRYVFVNYLFQLWTLWLAIAVSIYARVKLGKRRFAIIKFETFLNFTAVAISALIAMSLYEADRALWPAVMMSVIQILRCVNLLTSYRHTPYKKMQLAAFGVLVVAYGAWSCSLAWWSHRFKEEDEALITALRKSKLPLVYMDMTEDCEVPYYLMGMVHHEWKNYYGSNLMLALNTGKGTAAMILPSRCAGIPLDSLTIEGTDKIKGVYPTLFSTETNKLNVTAYFSGSTPGTTPINRLLAKFVDDPMPLEMSSYIPSCPFEPKVEIDGKTYYLYFAKLTRRTAERRKLVRIDVE